VSDRPLRHGPLDEIVPGAGVATAITAAAQVPSGELAVLCAAASDCDRGFTGRDLELLDELSASCAAAIPDAALGARLEPTMNVVAGGLSSRRDDETPRPIDTPALATQVGAALGLEQSALAELDMAARACELTVVQLDTIEEPGARRRFGPPTPAPAHIVEQLVDVPGFEAVAIVIRFLAERWDGEGEPHGLRGEQIPLASRILAGCLALQEAFDSRGSTERALRRLSAQAGDAFDPVVVDAIAHVLKPAAAPLDAEGWARADAQFDDALLAAVV
jgi:hypothetical protein